VGSSVPFGLGWQSGSSGRAPAYLPTCLASARPKFKLRPYIQQPPSTAKKNPKPFCFLG
jgi:hypothetical protein